MTKYVRRREEGEETEGELVRVDRPGTELRFKKRIRLSTRSNNKLAKPLPTKTSSRVRETDEDLSVCASDSKASQV